MTDAEYIKALKKQLDEARKMIRETYDEAYSDACNHHEADQDSEQSQKSWEESEAHKWLRDNPV